MTSRILGLVRDQVLAYLFGAGNAMDAFNVAFRLPNLVRDLFAEGAMSSAFVPTFTRRLARQGKDEAWGLANQAINALLLVTGAIVIAGIVFAEPLTRLFAGSYASVPGKLELTVTLTRIMFPFLTLVAIAAVFMGMLNSLRRFFIPALSPALFNVGTILCVVLLAPLAPALGLHPVAAAAIGAIVGGLGQLFMQWPSLRAEGYRYRPVFDPRDEGLREILLLMGPGTIGLAATQVNLLVNTVLATGQGTGAVSWLNFAFRLMYLPIGLFGVSIATAAVPSIARSAAVDDLAGMRRTISNGLRLMLMLNVPAAVGLFALATPIVSLIFERGSFTNFDTLGTAAALTFYAPGLVGYSAVKIAVPSFYALRDSRTPVLTSVSTVVLNVGMNVALVRMLGYQGLALGTALAAWFNAIVLLWLLRRRLGGLDLGRVATALVKITIAAALMGIAAFEAERAAQLLVPGQAVLAQTFRLMAAIAIALLTLALAARVLRIREFDEAVRQVTVRFVRPRSTTPGASR